MVFCSNSWDLSNKLLGDATKKGDFLQRKIWMCPQQSNSDYHSHHSHNIIVIEFNDYHVIIDECNMCVYIYIQIYIYINTHYTLLLRALQTN